MIKDLTEAVVYVRENILRITPYDKWDLKRAHKEKDGYYVECSISATFWGVEVFKHYKIKVKETGEVIIQKMGGI